MASLTPNKSPSPSNNPNSAPSSKLSPSKHAHSHSHSGNSTSPSPAPALSPAPNKLRSSVDVGKSLNIAAGAGSPFPMSPGGRGRPSSEMLGLGGGGLGNFVSPESEAIDKWFEDLQNYEATLEEMAAASLDPNFKEELSAIEQWFKVLSEAERTAALYSLIQNCTQVQIRFFLTVLQQMNRADPMTALLSPANPAQASMEAQMEAKLAQMGLKSPVPIPPSPSSRNFSAAGRQSLGAGEHLSPNANTNRSPAVQAEDPAATLAEQRAKLNKAQANRISAPALLKDEKLWNDADRKSPEPSAAVEAAAETAATGSGQTLTVGNAFPNGMLSPQVATVRAGGMKLEDQLSPIVGGNWASMVNTPMVPMFNNHTPDLGSVNSKLGGAGDWGKATGGDSGASKENGKKEGFTLDDARKFRRNARTIGGSSNGNGSANVPHSMQLSMGGGALSGMYDSNSFGGNRRPSAANSVANSNNSPLPPGLQAAAIQAQNNWRSGLLSPGAMSGTGSGISDDSSMFAMGGMGMGMGGMGMGGLSPNQAMMNLLAAQQQVQQLQQLQNMQAAMGMMGGGLSPGRLGMGMGMGMGGMGMMGMGGMGANRRSPGRDNNRSGNKPVVAGSGANPEEAIDMNLLNDVPGWLRSLRLHKYTDNFQGMTWKDMVVMDDAQLEAKGVAALGARRKMLKIFEVVQVKTGMKEPSAKKDDDESTSS
ncbi:hypothetical protein BT69DRAFT_1336114 [Atractiella rhizophila]|nr:hypothetical protein BT69DRAFT_1336114 [Atractiella rhizophila]